MNLENICLQLLVIYSVISTQDDQSKVSVTYIQGKVNGFKTKFFYYIFLFLEIRKIEPLCKIK